MTIIEEKLNLEPISDQITSEHLPQCPENQRFCVSLEKVCLLKTEKQLLKFADQE